AIVTLCAQEAGRYNLNAGDSVAVQAGTQIQTGRIKIGTVRSLKPLSANLLAALNWPGDVRYHWRYSPVENKLLVGPLIGILTHRPAGKNYSSRPHLRTIQRYARRMGIVAVVFCAQDVCWENGTIEGMILRSSGWVRRVFPIPKVIYNRIFSRRTENRPEIAACKQALSTLPGLVLFNPRYFDKWEIHEHLRQTVTVRSLLPETKLLEQPADIWPLVNTYGLVYLKPVHGSQGVGIFRVGIRRKGGYYFQSRNFDPSLSKALSKEHVEKKVKKLLGVSTYVAQQGLRLARIGGSPFDLRLLVQKDGKGVWRITKAFGRVAAPGRFTANLSQGGKAMGIRHTLAVAVVLRKRKRAVVIKELEKWGSVLPKVLEENTGLNLGELGLDLGLDRYGRLWLLEINSKPRKRLVTEEGDPRQVRLSMQRPLAYGRSLDGF
ncbi:MAG: YheC/YheD family protein, partial [Heliobacteriaceae bacterium]|nr:YheC/YheD family protein [Heliobacteriaceae bacterium]